MLEHRRAVEAALCLLALVGTAEAQTPLLVPGVRVRVTGPCLVDGPGGPAQCDVVVGRLRSWTPDTVVVQQGSGAARVIARRATRLVEVSDGIRSHRTLGTFVGAGVGLAVGLAAPCRAEPSTDPGNSSFEYASCTLLRWLVVPITVGVGASAGWLVGTALKSETWVSLGGDVAAIGVAPRGTSGIALVMSVRW